MTTHTHQQPQTETTPNQDQLPVDNQEPLGMCNWIKPYPGIEADALAWYRQGTAPTAADASPDQDVEQAEHVHVAATSDNKTPGIDTDDTSLCSDTKIIEEGAPS